MRKVAAAERRAQLDAQVKDLETQCAAAARQIEELQRQMQPLEAERAQRAKWGLLLASSRMHASFQQEVLLSDLHASTGQYVLSFDAHWKGAASNAVLDCPCFHVLRNFLVCC